MALEQRLAARSKESSASLNFLRKLVAFERLLARLESVAQGRWVLKGGVALDVRWGEHARATMDVDLARQDDEAQASADFQAVELSDLGDFFRFEIQRTSRLDNADVGGAVRYKCKAFLAERRFEEFVVDVGFADMLVAPPDELDGPDLLAFADLPPVHLLVLPLAQHVAEKVHAYTRRYGEDRRPSTRVKDLVDLVLFQQAERFLAGQVRVALEHSFSDRGTHPLPNALPPPPAAWRVPYASMARTVGIPPDIDDGLRLAAAFLNPILRGSLTDEMVWDPHSATWGA